MLDSLRLKHKSTTELLNDEISDLRLKLSDAKEAQDKYRVERDSLRMEVDKMHEQVRVMKDEASLKYEAYSKSMS